MFVLLTILLIVCKVTNDNNVLLLESQEIEGYIDNFYIKNNKVTMEIKSKEKMLVYYYLRDKEIFDYNVGDKIKLSGELSEANNSTNFNLFNYKKYLKSKSINYIFEADSISLISKNSNVFYSIKSWLIEWIKKYNSSSYLNTFILGSSKEIDDFVINSYQNNGISHLFSVSGMHVSLLSVFLLKMLKLKIKNNIVPYVVVSLFLIFYAFLTGFSPSIIRAVLLFIIANANKLMGLNVKLNYLYVYMVCVILIINPYLVYNTGFLFSYSITFALILFSGIINNYKNYFIKVFMTSLISFLTSIPILVNSYFTINLLSIILNVIFVPFVSIILFPFSLITLLFPVVDNLFMALINIMENMSLFFSKFTFLTFTMKYMNIYVVILYYVFIIFLFYKFQNKRYIYGILFFVFVLFYNNINVFNRTPYLTMIDVGQGDCILIVLPFNKGNILVDTGGIINYYGNSYSLAENTIIPYLKSEGIKKIDYLIISHGDYDHMGEAINLVENFKVEKVIFNCGPYNDLEKDLIKVLDKEKIPYYSCIKELNIDDNKLYFLNNEDYGNENDNSNVIYTELNNHKFLFMGDAGVEVEEDLIQKYNLQNIDVLKVAHHGSKTSSSKIFIDEIEPKYSIISVGKNNRYGHPNDEVLDNLEDSKIYRTDLDGSIMFKIKKNRLQIETCSP